MIFNKNLIKKYKERHIYNIINNNYDNYIFDLAYNDVLERLKYVNKDINDVLEIGAKSSLIAEYFKNKNFFQSNFINNFFRSKFPIVMDQELLCFQNNIFDLVVSVLELHQIDNIPNSLIQIRNILKDSGILIASLFSAGTLNQLRNALVITSNELNLPLYPQIFPFIKEDDIVSIMQKIGFRNLVVDSFQLKLSYDSCFHLMHDIRKMGQSNSMNEKSKKYHGMNFFKRLNDIYRDLYICDDNKLIANFNISTITAFR